LQAYTGLHETTIEFYRAINRLKYIFPGGCKTKRIVQFLSQFFVEFGVKL
jgi:hypothetical protein